MQISDYLQLYLYELITITLYYITIKQRESHPPFLIRHKCLHLINNTNKKKWIVNLLSTQIKLNFIKN